MSHLKVASRFQGQGVATLLMAGVLRHVDHLAKAARKETFAAVHQRLQLSVIELNQPAKRLYQKLGFTEKGRHGAALKWISLRREGQEGSSTELVEAWLRLVPGGGASDAPPAPVAQVL